MFEMHPEEKTSGSGKGKQSAMGQDRSRQHKTLEERAAEYEDKLNLDGELDWKGDPEGKEAW